MKKMYVAPELEWLNVVIEQGFAATQNQDFEEDPNEIEIG